MSNRASFFYGSSLKSCSSMLLFREHFFCPEGGWNLKILSLRIPNVSCNKEIKNQKQKNIGNRIGHLIQKCFLNHKSRNTYVAQCTISNQLIYYELIGPETWDTLFKFVLQSGGQEWGSGKTSKVNMTRMC